MDEGLLRPKASFSFPSVSAGPPVAAARWRTSVCTLTMNRAAGMPLSETSPTRKASRPSSSWK